MPKPLICTVPVGDGPGMLSITFPRVSGQRLLQCDVCCALIVLDQDCAVRHTRYHAADEWALIQAAINA
jgi:hypothetical protein